MSQMYNTKTGGPYAEQPVFQLFYLPDWFVQGLGTLKARLLSTANSAVVWSDLQFRTTNQSTQKRTTVSP
jgi:hypothetical protein